MLTSTQRAKRIPLYAAQKSIYYFEKLYPSTDTYHHTIVCDLAGDLNIDTLSKAVQSLMDRHETLQYKLVESEGQIYLEPTPPRLVSSSNWPFQVFDFSGINTPPPPVEAMLNTLRTVGKEGFITQGFALNKEPLWRCALLQFPGKRYQFLMVAHHIIVDVASKNILMKDLSEIYNSLIEQRAPNEFILPPLPAVGKLIPQSIDNAKLELWKKTLSDLSPLDLKTDFMPQTEFRCRGDRVCFEIDTALIEQLTALATAQNVSLHRIFLTSLYILLYRYTGQTDICIGTASANRRNYSENVDNIVSCFVNSIPVRTQLDGNMNFYELLQKLSSSFIEALKNQLPFDIIASQAMGKKEKIKTNTASPFDVIFDLNELRTSLTLKDVQASYPSELNLGHSKFRHFGLNLDRLPNGSYRGFIEYNTDLFKANTITRIKDHLINIWTCLARNPQEKISEIFFLTPDECKLLTQANMTEPEDRASSSQDYDFSIEDQTIVDIFRETVKICAKSTAVVFHKSASETESMTYEELHKKAEILASLLRACGIRPDKRVGISLSRSLNLSTAIWSVFKAGGVLLPLETTASEALDYKVFESNPKVIIVDNTTKDLELFKACNGRITIINIDNWSQLKAQASKMGISSIPEKLQADNLAYITYTSGSTGEPKGVMTTHRGLTNAANAVSDRKLLKGSKVLGTAKPNFDCFFFEMLEALMTGGQLHLIFEDGRLSPSILQEIIARHQLNAITLLPHISNYLDFERLPSLNDIVIMGAIANEETIKRLMILVQQRRGTDKPLSVRIEYGVQEASIFSTENPYDFISPHTSIGKPIRKTKLFILDKNGIYECPVGVPGEIHISGPSLARGYSTNQALTDEKFLTRIYHPEQHKFTPIPEQASKNDSSIFEQEKKTTHKKHHREDREEVSVSASTSTSASTTHASKKIKTGPSSVAASATASPVLRLYKTGDRARRLEDGSIEFIGRIEENKQVKIHGVRVEVDSIVTHLQRHPNIRDALVTFNPEKETLKGYFVLKDSSNPLTRMQINAFLRKSHLPHVARLSTVFFVDKFPINSNGKIKVSALDEQAAAAASNNNDDTEMSIVQGPQNDLERQLKTIWDEVLDTNVESINECFDDLGGDSLTLITLETRLNEKLPFLQKISVLDLNFSMTIKSLAAKLAPNVITNAHLFRNPSTFFDEAPANSSGNNPNAPQPTTTPFTWSLQ